MATLKISDDLQNVIKKVVLDTYYPIGKLYLSVGDEDPNQTIGGTWIKLSGYYLYADTSINNTSYTGKHTQGHALTVDQIPSHDHFLKYASQAHCYADTCNGGDSDQNYGELPHTGWALRTMWPFGGWERRAISSVTGGGQTHSHNIATKGIYVWQRTA